ncbi:MAG: hypothetical protein K2J60_03740 [Acetatifactor sp.]|nr:hypothetical protein [Acetatifactor sp.]
MSKFSQFMKQNKIKKENEKYAPTSSIIDSDGKPLCWEFKHLTTRENEDLREKCSIDVQITGKPNMFRQKLQTSKYLVGMICASTVYPDLYNAELQDSYGVKTPEDLVYEMIDNPGEYSELTIWIQKFNGFDETINEKVDDAKNS